MRKRRLSIPTIRADKFSTYSKGSYSWLSNIITLGPACRRLNEDTIIKILIHETDHWAQNMYLDSKERNDFIKSNRDHYPIILEYANIIPGDYDYTEIESKYNRGITACKFE